MILAGVLAGAVTSSLCGGMQAGKRILCGGLAGLLTGLTQIGINFYQFVQAGSQASYAQSALKHDLLPAFSATLLGLIAAALVELARGEPAKPAQTVTNKRLTTRQSRSTMSPK